MKTLITEQVRELQDKGDNFLLINVLEEDAFKQQHIPGSINIPVSREDFPDQVEQASGDKNKKIVVYCASTNCNASPKAAEMLEKAGFSNVFDYEAGMAGWLVANQPTEKLS